jgi:predicted lipid-binding transport protein (Tim44 family)
MPVRFIRRGDKMNKLMMIGLALLSLALIAPDADAARRLGGGSNLGSQRSIAPPAPKAPAQQAAPASPPAQPQPAGNKWLGPLAGLALGAGLAALFFNNGLGGALGGILTMLLVAAAVVFAVRLLRSRMQPASARPLQFAAAGTPAPHSDLSSSFGGAFPKVGSAATVNRFPPGFDAEQFAHHAKLNFTRLQAANDARDLAAMRDFMTPALYAEIEAQIKAASDAAGKTDVVTLAADVLEVVTENEMYIASVRFSGTIRERADQIPEPFSEVWHLEKPLNGSTGWLISGIQQD